MKKVYLITLVTLVGLAAGFLSSCRFRCIKGSGRVVTEQRTVSDFKKIDVSGSFKIVLKQDSSLKLTIESDDNLLKYIKTEVSGNKLRISTPHRNFCNDGQLVVTIGVKNLEAIKSSGAVELSTIGKLKTQDLNFDLSGIAHIDFDLDAANVRTEGSGAADIILRGQASSHNIDVSGGAKIHAYDFIVGDYNISSSGASTCEINVLHSLNVNSSGVSTIKYKGNPTSVNNDNRVFHQSQKLIN